MKIADDALFGIVWQTKVDRKRKGTRFAAPRCSLSGTDWLHAGWKVFEPFRTDRDYFLWDLKTDREFTEAPISYTRGLAWLKHVLIKGIGQLVVSGRVRRNEVAELEASVQGVTWHSMRVTFLAEAVKANVDDKIVGLQANWKDPKQLVLKYEKMDKKGKKTRRVTRQDAVLAEPMVETEVHDGLKAKVLFDVGNGPLWIELSAEVLEALRSGILESDEGTRRRLKRSRHA